jgi:hypothetical protein
VILNAIETDLRDNHLIAALRYLPAQADCRKRISRRTARELLEATSAWTDASKDDASGRAVDTE